MNDVEINGIAQGIMLYLQEQCPEPMDALAVILCLVLTYYERAKKPEADFPITDFAKQFGEDMVTHWNTRRSVVEGTETMQ
jgi:hypothetical protein